MKTTMKCVKISNYHNQVYVHVMPDLQLYLYSEHIVLNCVSGTAYRLSALYVLIFNFSHYYYIHMYHQ